MLVVDESFLTDDEIKEVQDLFLSNEVQWHFHKITTDLQSDMTDYTMLANDSSCSSSSYFTKVFFLDVDGYPKLNTDPKLQKLTEKIFYTFIDKHKIDCQKIIRMRSNLSPIKLSDNKTPAHVDQKDEHLIFLYYINDSDGDTVLYEEYYDGLEKGNLKEAIKITPKAGKAVVFDGLRFHSITAPRHTQYRAVINLNFYSNDYGKGPDPSFESDPIKDYDAMGREKFWQDMGRP